jgi:hypothetical protein
VFELVILTGEYYAGQSSLSQCEANELV